MDKIEAWFTPARRKAIYNAGVAIFALLIAVGVVSPELVAKFQGALLAAGGIFALLTNALASRNVNPADITSDTGDGV